MIRREHKHSSNDQCDSGQDEKEKAGDSSNEAGNERYLVVNQQLAPRIDGGIANLHRYTTQAN